MQLRHSSTSPFVRKVLVFAHECGLAEDIKLIPGRVWDPTSDITADNPMGRVPALMTPDGTFTDSLLCCEYLDHCHSRRRLIPCRGTDRWHELAQHALANGVMEAAVAIIVEQTRRPAAFVYPGQIARQSEKITRTLIALAALPAPQKPFRLGVITLACALGYLDFRLPQLDWRTDHPPLATFYHLASQRPSLRATMPSDTD
jgi:glutathione S-transferase